MKTRRHVVVLALLLALVVAGIGWPLAKNNSPPAQAPASPPASPREAPREIPAKIEPPAVPPVAIVHAAAFSDERSAAARAADDALAEPYRRKLRAYYQGQIDRYDAAIAVAADAGALAKLQQQRQDAVDARQKALDALSQPPLDLGDVLLPPAGAGPVNPGEAQTFTLDNGAKLTFTVVGSGAGLQLVVTTSGGLGTSSFRVTPTPGQPMAIPVGDGLVKFTPVSLAGAR